MNEIKIGINCLSFNSIQRNGAEEVLLNLCNGFKKNGHEKNLIFFCYKSVREKLIQICPKSNYITFEDRKNINHLVLSNIFIQTFCFHKIYLKYSLDIIFFANAQTGLFRYKVPTIVLPHDIQSVSHPENQIEKNRIKQILYKCLYKLFYKIDFSIADKVIAISKTDKKEIIKYYPQIKKKVYCIYNPLKIQPISEIETDKDNYIIAVNIQYKHKNIITLIKAFKLVNLKMPNIELYLVGQESACTKYLKKYTRANQLNEKVHFLGYIPREELICLWKKARLYVNPSLYEGFGMTSVESVLLGAPTLLSNIPVNREVTEGLCEYFNEYKNPEMLAKKILDILNKPINVKCLQENQRKLLYKYDYNIISKQYWKLFETIMKK